MALVRQFLKAAGVNQVVQKETAEKIRKECGNDERSIV